MKRAIIFSLTVFLLLSSSNAQLALVWENDSALTRPESVVYDQKRDCLYVSNFNRSPKNGMIYNKDVISRMNLRGEVTDKNFIDCLTGPTGLCLHNNMLYIVERFGIVVYNLSKEAVETRYRIRSTKFLNDVAVDSLDRIYVTVSDTNIIYRIENSVVEKWLEDPEIARPNGIMVDRDKIVVGICSDYQLKSVSITDKEITTIATLPPGIIDGIVKFGENYLVTHYEGNIYLVKSNGEVRELLNTRESGIHCADFEFIEDRNLFVIPDLGGSRVLGYKYMSPEEN